MLEWYRAGAALPDLMREVESLVNTAYEAVGRVAPAFRRTTVRDLFAQHDIDLTRATPSDLCATETDWDTAFFHFWVSHIEPSFDGALFVEDWPASQCALATVRDDGDWPTTQRFEAYVDGIELANAFYELVDTTEQRRRFMRSNEQLLAAGESANPIDEPFIEAVGNMPPTSGIALGVDRLVALAIGLDGIACARL